MLTKVNSQVDGRAREELARRRVITLRHVQRAFWATFITATIYYFVEPFFGLGSNVGTVLFVPLFLDFWVYSVLQFMERLAEPFLVWLATVTGVVWAFETFGWVLVKPLGWLLTVIGRFFGTLVSPKEFEWPPFPKMGKEADLERPITIWNEFRTHFRKALFETGVTFVLYWTLFGSSHHSTPDQALLYWPILYQTVRYTATQFMARLLEPYFVRFVGPVLSPLREGIGAAIVPVVKGISAALIFLVHLLTANYQAEAKSDGAVLPEATSPVVTVEAKAEETVQEEAQ